ncbi:HNH endonuclease [Aquisphaera insulae]|uniref:HNH endonuclease n=1 Tax=Aquisphaera insulae TaxID=2712864 RepID=UPI0013ECB2FC|nr:HNH endonuclease signature motif containing protein [Aquisphaera insulae]
MNIELERHVWQRARSCCEYCQLPQGFSPLPHAVDHIISQQHRGPTSAENLALACFFCNSYKGPNIAGLNPRTGRMVRLFHPRKDRWLRHFLWDGPVLVGRTHTGNVTLGLLQINRDEAVDLREYLIREGVFPPP